ncbi:MAG: RHS repeat-associated core domain-containing protein [Moheibacter sp.]
MNEHSARSAEFQDELGLGWYDYGARNYDPALGRFFNIDNYAEDYRYINPYQYTLNNPIYFVDVNGDCINIHYGKGQVESFCGDINGLSDQALQNDFVLNTVAAYSLLKSAYSFYNSENGTDYQSDFVNLVENGDVSVGFEQSSGGSEYDYKNEILKWNPDSGVNVGENSYSSLVVLDHEGGHGFRHQTNSGVSYRDYFFDGRDPSKYDELYKGTFFGDLKRESTNSVDYNYEEDINAVNGETRAAKVLGELPNSGIVWRWC